MITMRTVRRLFLSLFLFWAGVISLFAQNSYLDEPGIPASTTAFPVEHGFINLANGGLHIEIPLGGSYVQRGNFKALRPRLVYDSRFWTFDPNPDDSPSGWQPNGVTGYPAPFATGWRLIMDGQAGNPTSSQQLLLQCTKNGQSMFKTKFTNYRYQEPDGTIHRFPSITLTQLNVNCGSGSGSGTASAYASDNSGIRMDVANFVASAVYAPDGTQLFPSVQDTNGNFFTETVQQVTGVGFIDHVVDTLGREPVIASFSGNPVNQLFFDYLNPQGTRSRVTVALSSINAVTQFGIGGDFTGTLGVVQSITLADGTSYQFQEDSYGMITSMTLPTGGQVTYGYTNTTAPNQVNRWVSSRIADGQTWTFTPTFASCTAPCTPLTVTVTTPSYNDGSTTFSDNHVYSFFFASPNGGGGAWNTQVQYFRGSTSGTPLLTTTKEYNNGTNNSCTLPMGNALTPVLIRETLIWPTASGTLNKKAEYCYDSLGFNQITKKLWDYQANGNFAATPDREIDNTYVTDATYTNANLISLLQSTTVKDSTGAQASQTTYAYDESVPQPSGITTQLHTPSAPRGNLTSTHSWLNGSTVSTNNCPVSVGNGFLVSYTKYYDTGTTYQSTDACGNSAGDPNHTTTSNYSSSFAGAYVTSITNPLNQTISKNYDFNTGLETTTTDANSNPTSYTYDSMQRPLCANFPDMGQTCLSYPDANTVTKTTKINSSKNDILTTKYDGLGRKIQTQHSTPSGTALIDITYDTLGRPATMSNPYFLTSDSTYGITTTKYDAANRIISTTRQDGSVATTTYSANCATTIDEAGKVHKICHDGFRRTASVFEDPSGVNYETDYGYDALGNLLRVDQKGSAPGDSTQWRTRTFTYDSLSRLLCSANPEIQLVACPTSVNGTYPGGAIVYAYDANGNMVRRTAPATNQAGSATVITTSVYDFLNRIQQKSYSDVTMSTVNFLYDVAAGWGNPAPTQGNLVGRLSEVYTTGTNTGNQVLGYDSMGRIVVNNQCTPSNCGSGNWPVTATYDLAGNLTSLSYPSTRYVTYNYNSGNEMDQIQFTTFNGAAPSGGAYNYWSASDTNFYPSGTAKSWTYGNGIVESSVLNKRLQWQEETVSNSSIFTFADHMYGYGTQNNGNVVSITDQLNSTFTQAFTYDSLNRLATANEGRWGLGFGYDSWANRLQQNVTAGTASGIQITVDGKNHIQGAPTNCTAATRYCYDAAGNLLHDNLDHQYAYDAENRIIQVDNGTANYVYTAEGNRVRQNVTGSAGIEYLYYGGKVIAELNVSTGDWSDYIFDYGKRIARALGLDNGLRIYGNKCSACGNQYSLFYLQNAGGLANYTIRTGDKLALTQYQATGSHGGVVIAFTDGTNTNWSATDQDGYFSNDDGKQTTTHIRRIDLSSFAGKIVQALALNQEVDTAAGAFAIIYEQAVLISSDGTVRPIYTGQTTSPVSSIVATSGITGAASHIDVNRNKAIYPTTTTTYYHTNHLNSSTLITAGSGWPVWQATYLPYGEEYSPQVGDEHYKFTDKHRDAESNLDYFVARYYSSGMARFMSVDPVVITPGRRSDPQQLTRYTYVGNNPLRLVDPTGEILIAVGNQAADKEELCIMAGLSDCDRITIDERTGIVSFNTEGLNLSQNEGATLLQQLIDSKYTYGVSISDSIETSEGLVSLGGATGNIPAASDQTVTRKPKAGIDDQVTISPGELLVDSKGRNVPVANLLFHELAEAYAKVDEGKPYSDFVTASVGKGDAIVINPETQVGAHNEAVQRELKMREQQPSLRETGRAGDSLKQMVREPH